jgi:hypothetical protein
MGITLSNDDSGLQITRTQPFSNLQHQIASSNRAGDCDRAEVPAGYDPFKVIFDTGASKKAGF